MYCQLGETLNFPEGIKIKVYIITTIIIIIQFSHIFRNVSTLHSGSACVDSVKKTAVANQANQAQPVIGRWKSQQSDS